MISFVLISIVICAYALWVYKVHLKRGHDVPPLYPGWMPIIGHAYLLIGDGKNMWRLIKAIAVEVKKQGGVSCMLFGSDIYYVISDPEDALTAANSCLQKHYGYGFAKPWLGDGLITGSGEIWKRHRKLLLPAFSLPVTYSFLDIFNSQSRLFVESVKHEVGKRFDHNVYLRNFALETFCLTAFGITDIEDKDFVKKYMDTTDEILKLIVSRFQSFWFHNDIIYRLCGPENKLKNLVKVVNDMFDKVIQRKKAISKHKHVGESASKTSGIRYKPFLDLLLELSEDDALTDKEIREEVDTAIIAGFDTTSTVLTYIFIQLGNHPTVQEKMLEEIKTVLKTDRDVEKEDFQKLSYMEAVIKETLRVYSPGPIIFRYVDKDVKLKNYTMRAGSQCMLNFYGTHRDPIWGEDVEEFRPERWLHDDRPVDPEAYVGFSLGKRACIGKTYAMLTMKTTLVHFLRRYRITADDSDLQLQYDFILKPSSGHEILIEERI